MSGEDILKDPASLLKARKRLRENGLFLLETTKTLLEALKAGYRPELFLCSAKDGPPKEAARYMKGCETRVVKESYIERLASVKAHSGFVAVMKEPAFPAGGWKESRALVVMDSVQDPSNVGAIVRSGAAYGFTDYYLIGCARPYAEKCVRSSAGALFYCRFFTGSAAELPEVAKRFYLIAAGASGGKEVRALKAASKPAAIIFGSEGKGISARVLACAEDTFTIDYPNKKIESLNVAAAAAIIFEKLYAARSAFPQK